MPIPFTDNFSSYVAGGLNGQGPWSTFRLTDGGAGAGSDMQVTAGAQVQCPLNINGGAGVALCSYAVAHQSLTVSIDIITYAGVCGPALLTSSSTGAGATIIFGAYNTGTGKFQIASGRGMTDISGYTTLASQAHAAPTTPYTLTLRSNNTKLQLLLNGVDVCRVRDQYPGGLRVNAGGFTDGSNGSVFDNFALDNYHDEGWFSGSVNA